MRSEIFDFSNARGEKLSGRLDRSDGEPHAWALFAHCFTCDKTVKAAVRISRALADQGVGVLRFDFAGLGQSEGVFGRGGFSANVDDLVAAADAMRAHGCNPQLLIGHSLGGAAMLAAAGRIAGAKAVATIGACADPAHILLLLKDGLDAIERDGKAEVSIQGRTFTLDKSFVDDVRSQHLLERVAHLGRALLVMHSPIDETVGIENAAELFTAAKHPKSFISLDKADHLLSRREDGDYVARMVVAWASRYVGMAADAAPQASDGAVMVEDTGVGKFQVQVSVHGVRFLADEPAEVGGLGSGPSPYELVAAGLGACTAMTVRLYADRKGWPVRRTRVSVRHDKVSGAVPTDQFTRRIGFEGDLDAEQTAKLFEIAEKCPVHRTLESGSTVITEPLPAPVAAPATAPETPAALATAEEHFRDMDKACREAGAV
ncbi:MAG TPA: alpha/beta fold hydrolase [Caulobacteraceae bacterium]|jgi:putative redox protein|nr:alpha/beta fold hydrolase [Caulobacteraceae bacterium]